MKVFIKNISYAVGANLISFIISALITLVVPKFLTVDSYGYFQLYLFYLSYIGFCCLGWIDGIVLRFGGEYYDRLDKRKFSGQFRLYSAIQVILGILVVVIANIVIHDPERQQVIFFLGIAIILSLPCSFFRYLLQAVNYIEEYSKNVLIERVLYAVFVMLALAMGSRDFSALIYADLIGKTVALFHILFCCRSIVTAKVCSIKTAWSEGKENIICGSKLLLANGASLLIVGIVRYAIGEKWDIETFAKVSFSLNVSNLFMVFIRAVSVVVFPMIKRSDNNKLQSIYTVMRSILMIPLFAMLILYYPIKVILTYWLPSYADSLNYMALMFPICIFESKTAILIETYMKTFRKEKWLLSINCLTVALSCVLTAISVIWLENLNLAVISLVALLAFRCIVSEIVLKNCIEHDLKKDIVKESILVIVFMISSWCIGGLFGLMVYSIFYLIYLYTERSNISLIKNMIYTKL